MKKIFWMIMAVIGYISLILEVTVVDGGVLLAMEGVFFQWLEQLGCVFVLKNLEIGFFSF